MVIMYHISPQVGVCPLLEIHFEKIWLFRVKITLSPLHVGNWR